MNIGRAVLTISALICLSAGSAAAGLSPETRARIAELQETLDTRGARWTAGETEVSGLTEDQWSSLTGLDANSPSGPLAPEPPETRLARSLDWRDNGGNFVTVPKRQGGCGSCWSFAMTGALESYVMRKRGKPGMDIDLSEQVYISCSSVGSCGGGVLFPRFLTRRGLPPESAYPYAEADGSCSNAASGWERKAHKIGGWGMVLPTVKKLKAALAHYGPLPTSMMIYEDFLHYKSGIYSRVGGKRVGAHAVLLVGYNDAEEYFIVKNSWGPGWGEDGFFRIDYSEMSSRVIFGLTTVAYH